MSFETDVVLDKARQGDRAAFDRLLEYGHEQLRRCARLMLRADFPDLGRSHGTDSILNRVWERELRRFSRDRTVPWPDERAFLAWLRVAVKNTLVDLAREARRGPVGPGETDNPVRQQPASDPSPEAGAMDREGMESFWRLVEGLTEEEKTVFDLRFIAESPRPYREIAARLQTNVTHVHRVWAGIRDRIAPYFTP